MKSSRSVKSLVIVCVVFLVSLIVTRLVFSQLNINATDSMGYIIGWIDESTSPKLGDVVVFEFSHEYLEEYAPGIKHLTKRIKCDQGSFLENRGREFWCDGEYIGKAKEKSLKGEDLPLFEFEGIIPSGKTFVLGDHKDSFDSRYWGFISYDELSRVEVLI